MDTSDFKDISYKRDQDGIVTLKFNTPARKNALSMYSFYELYLAIEAFENDDQAFAMILTGADDASVTDPARQTYSSGGYFSSDAYSGLSAEVLAKIDQTDIAQKRTTMKMFMCDKPILAAVNGLAIGGAVTLTLAGSDQIYMSEHAWFQLPFAKLGICAELASSFLLPRLLGMQKAKEIMFFAERIDAQTAHSLHLANAVVPHNELLAYTREKALQLVPPHGAPQSIRAMKKLLRAPLVDEISNALDRENQALASLFDTADFAEAMLARQERRAALFTGQ
jgi:enoyl-CoA hydratase/carnithine racemase